MPTQSECDVGVHNFPRAMAMKVDQLPMTSMADTTWDKIQDSRSQELRVDDCTRRRVEGEVGSNFILITEHTTAYE